MAIIYKVDKRRNLPRWRSYDQTKFLGELSLLNKDRHNAPKKVDRLEKHSLSDEIEAWRKNRNITTAGNLLSAAFVLNVQDDFKDVAEFILEEDKHKPSSLYTLASKVLRNERSENHQEKSLHGLDNLKEKFGNDIHRIRIYLKQEPKNPIAWVELGRLYSLIGKIGEAKKCVLTSLNIEKNNRYIVRSASRFFHHFEKDSERALHIIKQSDFLKVDPWLISAEVAFSSVLERHSKLVKVGVDYLDKNITDFFSITELASSIGTVEHSNGKQKKAKQYFEQSLIEPNDNSLAQTSWIMDDNAEIREKLLTIDIPCAFEARAKIAYDQNKFQDSFNNAMGWLYDEPFSTRPIRLSSYIAGTFLNKVDKSVDLIRFGLSINPDDTALLNDLIYFLIQNGQVEDGIKLFNENYDRFIRSKNDETPKLIYAATAGLIFYKQGLKDQGEALYLRAIAQAQKNGDSYLEALAIANYLDQEIQVSDHPQKIQKWMIHLQKISKYLNAADVSLFEKKLIKKIDRYAISGKND